MGRHRGGVVDQQFRPALPVPQLPADVMSATQDFAYEHDGLRLKGQIARPSGRGLHPAVLVMHSALGIDRLVCRRAGDLAALGYVALATDMYGAGRQLTRRKPASTSSG
jgi:dienelactone hydrolase